MSRWTQVLCLHFKHLGVPVHCFLPSRCHSLYQNFAINFNFTAKFPCSERKIISIIDSKTHQGETRSYKSNRETLDDFDVKLALSVINTTKTSPKIKAERFWGEGGGGWMLCHSPIHTAMKLKFHSSRFPKSIKYIMQNKQEEFHIFRMHDTKSQS